MQSSQLRKQGCSGCYWSALCGLVVLGFVILVPQVYGIGYDTVYVDSALGDDSYTGSSPTYVGGNVGPKATIQVGVDVTNPGGICFVAKGTYHGGVALSQDIFLIGAGYWATIIDTGHIYASNIKGRIEGFTVMHTNWNYAAYGIRLWDACSVVVKDNVVKNCDYRGIGILHGGDNVVINNLIINNGQFASEKGIADSPGEQMIINNTVAYNTGRGYNAGFYTSSTLINNIVANNTFMGIEEQDSSDLAILYNNVWGNNPNFGGEGWDSATGDTTWGVNRNGIPCDSFYNISRDPLFVAYGDDSFYLSQIGAGQAVQSPCVDAGDTVAGFWGLDVYTTRTDTIFDSSYVDMGFHYLKKSGPQWIEEKKQELRNEQLEVYPNPVVIQVASVRYQVSGDRSQELDVRIQIYDVAGRLVQTLVNETQKSGYYIKSWDTEGLANGVYLMKLMVNGYKAAEKLVLVR